MVRSRFKRFRRFRRFRRRRTIRPRRYRRRMPGRRFYKRRGRTLHPRGRFYGLVPSSKTVVMRWVYHQELAVGTVQGAATLVHAINLGSVYDPDAVVGAGQASAHGYALYRVLYNHYMVMGARVSVRVTPTTAAGAIAPAVLVWKLDDDGHANLNATTWQQQVLDPACHYRYVGTDANTFKPKHISIGYSPRKFFGFRDYKDQIQGPLGALMDTDPRESCYLLIGLYPQNAGVVASPYVVDIVVDYKVHLSERKDFNGASSCVMVTGPSEEGQVGTDHEAVVEE